MLKNQDTRHRLYEAIFLAVLSLFCFGVSQFRLALTKSAEGFYLNWNLFLAFIPWCVSSFLILHKKFWRIKWIGVVAMLVWLAFFPNAPYIMTDLIHLHTASERLLWFDLLFFLSYAWTGLLFGFFSLWDIEEILRGWMRSGYVTMFSVFLLFLSSFGVYLGRFLRWNSWDLIASPQQLLHDIGVRILDPLSHRTTWGMTLFMGVFLNILYFSFRLIRNSGESIVSSKKTDAKKEDQK